MAVSRARRAVAALGRAVCAGATVAASSAGTVISRTRRVTRLVAPRAETFAVGVRFVLAVAEIAVETVVGEIHFVPAGRAAMPAGAGGARAATGTAR